MLHCTCVSLTKRTPVLAQLAPLFLGGLFLYNKIVRPPTPASAKKRAWHALSVFVRLRDKHCQTCPTGQAEHCGHYQRNSERSKQLGGNELWFDERNFLGQCAGCNLFANGRPVQAALVLQKKYGKDILQKLNKLYLTPKKFTLEEILAIAEHYEGLL